MVPCGILPEILVFLEQHRVRLRMKQVRPLSSKDLYDAQQARTVRVRESERKREAHLLKQQQRAARYAEALPK